jgi:RimJ/RimL family protein N-acetyltransferase
MPDRLNAFGQPIGPDVPGWEARPWPPRTAMVGRHCRIDPVDPARDADALFEAYIEAPDDRDWTYLANERPATLEAFRVYADGLAATADPFHHTISDLATGRPVGTAALMRIDPANGVIEIGWINSTRRLQRTVASTEAMFLFMTRVFDELGFRRYEWKCDSRNAPSRATAARLGFVFEGIFRQALVTKGRSRDPAWFSIIDAEWPALRRGYEAWLAPGNFDAEGRQIQRLADCLDRSRR